MLVVVAIIVCLILIYSWYVSVNKSFNGKLYFDYAATTPPSSKTLQIYKRYSGYGNLSQVYNRDLQKNIEEIKQNVIELICGNQKADLIWTSGASEANNTVFKALAATGNRSTKPHILVGNTEHHTSTQCLRDLEKQGMITWDVFANERELMDKLAIIYASDLANKIIVLVSLMHMNNELGTIYPVDKIFANIRQLYPRVLLHSDIVQSLGKYYTPKNLDFYTASGHKFGGPIGVGILAMSQRGRGIIEASPLIAGTQQSDMRGGTFNIPGVIATYYALYESVKNSRNFVLKTTNLRNTVLYNLSKRYKIVSPSEFSGLPDAYGFSDKRGVEICSFADTSQPGHILSFAVVKYGPYNEHFCNLQLKEYCLERDIIIATGSACSKGKSEVLENLRMPFIIRCGFIRVSFGSETKMRDIKKLCTTLISGINAQL